MDKHANFAGDLIDSVIVFNHTVVLSGGELALLSLIKGGLARKIHVHVDKPGDLTTSLERVPGEVTWSATYDSDRSEVHVGRRPGLLPFISRLGVALRMRRSYKKILKQKEYSVIYANTLRSVLILCTLNLRGKPLIFHQRDRISRDYLGFAASVLARLLIAVKVRHVIANSEVTAATTPGNIKHVEIIPSAVDDKYFDLVTPHSDDPVIFVMVGRLTEWKGQREFLQALVHLRDSHNCFNWQAILVGGPLFGETDYEDQLRAFTIENGLQDHVRLVGHTNDVPAYIEKSHVLVHASIVPEPFGQVVAQGMASGRAVVAASMGGPTSMLVNRVSGLLVDPRDSASLAGALHDLASSSTLRRRLGSAAREAAGAYRVDVIGNQIRHVLRDVQAR